jgi:hypothetical protein
MKWQKANYGGSDSKSGGGCLKGVTKGGLPSGATKVKKASVSKGFDTPTTKGNKGVDVKRGFPKAKAPKD